MVINGLITVGVVLLRSEKKKRILWMVKMPIYTSIMVRSVEKYRLSFVYHKLRD